RRAEWGAAAGGRAEQCLRRLGADAATHESGRLLRRRAGIRTQIIHLGNVTTGALQKDYGSFAAHRSLNCSLQIMDPVCGDPARIGGGMTGVVDDAAHQPALPAPDADNTHLRIDRTGVSDDAGITLARMRIAEAILHPYTPVEPYLVLDPEPETASRLLPKTVRVAHRGNDLDPDALQVPGVRARRFLIC